MQQKISTYQFRNELKDFVFRIFDQLGENPCVQVFSEPFGLLVEIDIQNPSRYIGNQGEGLGLIQHLIKTCFGTKYHPLPQFMVDIGEYKRKQISILKNIAVSNAIKVRKTGKSVELSPMSPFARRIIHLTLKDHPHCTTYSIGEGEQRRIVIDLKG